jgi:hypothetical protein
MVATAYRAHFDGEQIKLDEPASLKRSDELVVFVFRRPKGKKSLQKHPFKRILQAATDMGIEDLAENFDFYTGRRVNGSKRKSVR